MTLQSILKAHISLFEDTDAWIQLTSKHLYLVLQKYLKLNMRKMEDIVLYPHPHLFVSFVLVGKATTSSVSQGKHFGNILSGSLPSTFKIPILA